MRDVNSDLMGIYRDFFGSELQDAKPSDGTLRPESGDADKIAADREESRTEAKTAEQAGEA